MEDSLWIVDGAIIAQLDELHQLATYYSMLLYTMQSYEFICKCLQMKYRIAYFKEVYFIMENKKNRKKFAVSKKNITFATAFREMP